MAKKTKVSTDSLLREYSLRSKDVEGRLARNFCCYFNSGDKKFFIAGGDCEAAAFTTSNFASFIIGGSLRDVEEGRRLIKGVASRIATLYSERDFHATVAKYFLSQFLKSHLESKDTMVGLAVEFMFYDIIQRLTIINFNGDAETFSEDEVKGKTIFIGCYDKVFKSKVAAAIARELKKKVPKKHKEAEAMGERLKKTLKIKSIGIQSMTTSGSKGTPEVVNEDGDMEEK